MQFAWKECIEISIYKGENDNEDSDLSDIIGSFREDSDSCAAGTSLQPLDLEAPVVRRPVKVRKATGIPTHVMLLADMQKVIKAQHLFWEK